MDCRTPLVSWGAHLVTGGWMDLLGGNQAPIRRCGQIFLSGLWPFLQKGWAELSNLW
jgi:hypothetical protein